MSKGKQEAFVLVWARFRPQLASCLARIDDAIDPSFSIRYIKAVRRRSTCSRPLERKLPKPNETSRVDSCLPRVHNYARSNAITTYAAMPKGSPPVATPARVAKRSVETAHVMSTPRMSITTCAHTARGVRYWLHTDGGALVLFAHAAAAERCYRQQPRHHRALCCMSGRPRPKADGQPSFPRAQPDTLSRAQQKTTASQHRRSA
eukprot:6187215-Pleurochrysis_carterae.AAC.4